MIKKPVAIIVGLVLLFSGLAKCNAFSSENMPIPDIRLLPPGSRYSLLPQDLTVFGISTVNEP